MSSALADFDSSALWIMDTVARLARATSTALSDLRFAQGQGWVHWLCVGSGMEALAVRWLGHGNRPGRDNVERQRVGFRLTMAASSALPCKCRTPMRPARELPLHRLHLSAITASLTAESSQACQPQPFSPFSTPHPGTPHSPHHRLHLPAHDLEHVGGVGGLAGRGDAHQPRAACGQVVGCCMLTHWHAAQVPASFVQPGCKGTYAHTLAHRASPSQRGCAPALRGGWVLLQGARTLTTRSPVERGLECCAVVHPSVLVQHARVQPRVHALARPA